ncbi:ABC transporter ATP-binding protein [Nitrospina watsonii]|uniref:Intermembrane phospholipid transport system, ATP binding subunit MlaF n=1 Tax=Nitrospina watsonii TaxID=1323948 RepID=A0ABM9HFT8_9BACT|nr:ABC transporter ATP-binding protein [Nitrospina watsonii]CAI2719152.1 intermembrane phospholipid transport system, ATP binding subunit MlaF [Nitrospina watsonii]
MIKIRDLKKQFPNQEVLKGVSLDIPKGQITAVIGRSGTGKSVLLKHIIGLLKPDHGTVFVNGDDITQAEGHRLNELRKKFGMLFQNAALLDSMSVFDNIAFPLREKTKQTESEIRERVEEGLANVGIVGMNHKFPAELSGGMKKRVGLARALVTQPEIILFDEPTTGLDPIMKKAIHKLIYDTQRRFGFTAVMVSHDIPEVFDFVDQVAMLFDGVIHETGTPGAMQQSTNAAVQQFLRGDLDGPIQIN